MYQLQVHLRLGSTGKARALVKASLPVLLEHAPVRVQGEAWLTLAKCHLQEVSQASLSAAASCITSDDNLRPFPSHLHTYSSHNRQP